MRRIWAHLSIVLSLIITVLMIFQHFNPLMNFLDNPFAHAVILLLCLTCSFPAVLILTMKKRK